VQVGCAAFPGAAGVCGNTQDGHQVWLIGHALGERGHCLADQAVNVAVTADAFEVIQRGEHTAEVDEPIALRGAVWCGRQSA
jgi:hypothetical protein